MSANIFLEDALGILERYGNPRVRKVSYERAASPQLVGGAPEWECEVHFAGYWHTGYGQAYVCVRAPSPREAAVKCVAAAEDFLTSEKGREARQRYVDGHAAAVRRFENKKSWERDVQHPGPLLPEIAP